MNHIYIWAGAHAESLIEAQTSEDPDIRITSPSMLLDQLAVCITHPTFFREQREEFYNAHQKPDENTTTYFSRIMDLYRQAEFPENASFLVVDKLIHGCANRDCKKKLMAKNKNITTRECLEIMRRFESVEATMKKLGSSSDTQIDVSYATDPTKKSQKSGSRYKSHRHKTDKSNETKPCIWCNKDPHSRNKCPAKDATCNFCRKQGHFERACLQKKTRTKDMMRNKSGYTMLKRHLTKKAVAMKTNLISTQ
jgi:hypothetical protein